MQIVNEITRRILTLIMTVMLVMGAVQTTHAGEAPALKVFVRWSAFTPQVMSPSASASTRILAARSRLQGELQGVVPGSWVGRTFEHVGWSVIAVPASQKATALKKLKSAFGARNVSEVHKRRLYATPNDPDYGSQWWLPKIGAPAAWDTSTGSSSVVVAVLDTGVQASHPELAGNLLGGFNAINPGTSPEDDDVSSHGTFVTGVVGARGNNGQQVSGVNWNVKIVPVKVFDSGGVTDDPTLIQGMDYILSLKSSGVNVRAINASWGGCSTSEAFEDAFARLDSAGIMTFAAAGNGDCNNYVGYSIDNRPDYPSSYSYPTIVSVAASNENDARPIFSNYGANTVDIFAPGTDILSLASNNGTGSLDGTSMSSPMVMGAAALLWSIKPSLTPAEMKALLLNSAFKAPALNGLCVSNGRLDLAKAVASLAPTATATPIPNATATPVPTATPVATATPQPTATPTPVPPPVISVNAPSIYEGSSTTSPPALKPMVFTLKLSKASTQVVKVNVASTNASVTPATANVDYVPFARTTISFTPGQTSQNVTVNVRSDVLDEDNEKIRLAIATPINATLSTTGSEGTIVDDDGVPSVSVNDARVNEGLTGVQKAYFTVALSNPSSKSITVNWATLSATSNAATAGTSSSSPNIDYYTVPPTTLTFAPNQTSKVVTVGIQGDKVDELDEVFYLKLSSPVNVRIADNTGLGTIGDDDSTPTISVKGTSVTEGNTGSNTPNTLPFTVTLSGPSSRTITVGFRPIPGATFAAAPSLDYRATSVVTLTFAPLETSKTVLVAINGDASDEDNERVALELSRPVNAIVTQAPVEGIIVDDDAAPALSITDVSVIEGNEGATNPRLATFTVSLTKASGKQVRVNFTTYDRSALAGNDYRQLTGTLTFAPGETSKTLSIAINGDTTVEPNEQFLVGLSSAVNATVSKPVGSGTIVNDDTTSSSGGSA